MRTKNRLVPTDIDELLSTIRTYLSADSCEREKAGAVQFGPSWPDDQHPSHTALSEENFNEEDYLYTYPDVAAAVRRGEIKSGFEHWLKAGREEGRTFRTTVFDENTYLDANPDVAEEIRLGKWRSGHEHWRQRGRLEGRSLTRSMRPSAFRLNKLNGRLESALPEFTSPPLTPHSLRGKLGRWVILLLQKLLWWHIRSLSAWAELVVRSFKEQTTIFDHIGRVQHEQHYSIQEIQEISNGLADQLSVVMSRQEQMESQDRNWRSTLDEILGNCQSLGDGVRRLTADLDRERLARQSLESGFASLERKSSDIQHYARQLETELFLQRGRLDMLLANTTEQLSEPVKQVKAEQPVANGNVITDRLYLTFENTFRGPRDEVKQRQSIYLPYLTEAHVGTPERPLLDLGCGRGEWLELLREHHLNGLGVDQNSAVIEACRALALDVIESDVLSYLRSLSTASLGAITSFHMIEHLPFAMLTSVLEESFRVVRPGGILILETPNPNNLIVSAHNFYLDPTHVRPLPAAMLRFFVEAKGFCDSQVLELHPYPAHLSLPATANDPLWERLNHLLYGPQDYAIVARRP